MACSAKEVSQRYLNIGKEYFAFLGVHSDIHIGIRASPGVEPGRISVVDFGFVGKTFQVHVETKHVTRVCGNRSRCKVGRILSVVNPLTSICSQVRLTWVGLQLAVNAVPNEHKSLT